jgi:glycosyltransferase involved in cell wall biosynthesis
MRSDRYKAKCLEDQSVELTYIGPLREKYWRFFSIKTNIYNVFKKNYESLREPVILQSFANQILDNLSKLDVDIVFSHSSIPASFLECRQPIVFWVDATFAGMIDFYPEFSNLSQEYLRKGNFQEQSALTKCSMAIYGSEWAAETAIKHYQVEPSKIKVVPYGANLEGNRNHEDIDNFLKSRSTRKCNLLFFGVEWYRKGGDLAFDIAKTLNKHGLPTELNIIGCDPLVNKPLPDFIKTHGFINKTTQEGLEKINRVLSKTHFLIHPARAEANCCVLPEANSFGVPCVTTNVGGIPTVIKDNINGKLFSPRDGIDTYCDFITNSFTDFTGYKNLARSSFHEYQSRLNWGVAGMTVKKLLSEII